MIYSFKRVLKNKWITNQVKEIRRKTFENFILIGFLQLFLYNKNIMQKTAKLETERFWILNEDTVGAGKQNITRRTFGNVSSF